MNNPFKRKLPSRHNSPDLDLTGEGYLWGANISPHASLELARETLLPRDFEQFELAIRRSPAPNLKEYWEKIGPSALAAHIEYVASESSGDPNKFDHEAGEMLLALDHELSSGFHEL